MTDFFVHDPTLDTNVDAVGPGAPSPVIGPAFGPVPTVIGPSADLSDQFGGVTPPLPADYGGGTSLGLPSIDVGDFAPDDVAGGVPDVTHLFGAPAAGRATQWLGGLGAESGDRGLGPATTIFGALSGVGLGNAVMFNVQEGDEAADLQARIDNLKSQIVQGQGFIAYIDGVIPGAQQDFDNAQALFNRLMLAAQAGTALSLMIPGLGAISIPAGAAVFAYYYRILKGQLDAAEARLNLYKAARARAVAKLAKDKNSLAGWQRVKGAGASGKGK